jgi:hypothetical protein
MSSSTVNYETDTVAATGSPPALFPSELDKINELEGKLEVARGIIQKLGTEDTKMANELLLTANSKRQSMTTENDKDRDMAILMTTLEPSEFSEKD